jgi:hypothetical protein
MTERAEHTAFTPGPWSHEEGKFGMENVFSGREGIIAQTYCLGVKGQLPGVANARLIAAAPDLLAALAPFAEMLDGFPLGLPDEFEILVKIDATPCALFTIGQARKARAALSRATGEA